MRIIAFAILTALVLPITAAQAGAEDCKETVDFFTRVREYEHGARAADQIGQIPVNWRGCLQTDMTVKQWVDASLGKDPLAVKQWINDVMGRANEELIQGLTLQAKPQ